MISRVMACLLAFGLLLAVGAETQPALERALRLVRGGKAAEGLAVADQVARAARAGGDATGEAAAEQVRGLALLELDRLPEARAAYAAAGAAAERSGDAAAQIAALCGEAILWLPDLEAATQRWNRAVERAGREQRRPLEAALALDAAAEGLTEQGFGVPARLLLERALAIRERVVPGSLLVAESLTRIGSAHRTQGELAEARTRYEQGLALRARLAPDSLPVAESENYLGIVAQEEGNLAEARRRYQRALDLRERLAPGSPALAAVLGNRGGVAQDEGDLPGAERDYLRALALQQRLGPDSLDVAASLTNLGSLQRERGRLAEARSYHERALAIRRAQLPGSPAEALSWNNLGVVLHDQGDLSGARRCYEQARVTVARSAPESPMLLQSVVNLAGAAFDEGDLTGAETLYRQALALQERSAPDSPSTALTLHNLGETARVRGDLPAARHYGERSLALRERLAPGSTAVAASLNGLALTAVAQGDPARAVTLLERALTVQFAQSPDSLEAATLLSNLGVLRFRALFPPGGEARNVPAGTRPQAEAAVALLSQAWQRVRREGLPLGGDEARQSFQRTYSGFAGRLVSAQVAVGRPEEAFLTLEEGRAQALQQLLAEQGIAERLAPAPLWARYQRAARVAAQTAVELQRAGDAVGLARARSRERGGGQDQGTRQRDGSRSTPLSSAPAGSRELELAEAEFQRRQAAATGARLDSEQVWQEIRAALPQLLVAPAAPVTARAALAPGTLFLAFAVQDDETLVFAVTRDALNAHTLPFSRATLRRQVTAFRRAVLGGAGRGRRSAGPRGIVLPSPGRVEHEAPARELFQALFPPPVQAALRGARRVVLAPDDTLWELPFAALITNSTGAPEYLGLAKPLVYTQSLTLFARSGSRSSAAVRRPILAVGNPGTSDAPEGHSSHAAPDVLRRRRLSDTNSRPGERSAGRAKSGLAGRGLNRSSVTASSRRAKSPVRSGETPPQIEARAQRAKNDPGDRRGPSPRAAASAAAGVPRPAAEGAPGAPRHSPFVFGPPLPFAEREAQQVAALYGTAAVLGPGATESWLRRAAPGARILHLATHGYYHPLRSASSGIQLAVPALAPAPGETDNDGALQAWEIYSLRLSADLVVLSACETGLGEAVPGEGLVGLTRAWQAAGARQVMASLWKVADLSTSRLMVEFHRNLRRGVPADEALRLAMVYVQREYSLPYDWAAFTLLGTAAAGNEPPRQ